MPKVTETTEFAYFVNSVHGGANSGISSAVKFALMDTPDYNYATFLTNHDQNRVMSVFNGNVDKAKVASFLMLTLPVRLISTTAKRSACKAKSQMKIFAYPCNGARMSLLAFQQPSLGVLSLLTIRKSM